MVDARNPLFFDATFGNRLGSIFPSREAPWSGKFFQGTMAFLVWFVVTSFILLVFPVQHCEKLLKFEEERSPGPREVKTHVLLVQWKQSQENPANWLVRRFKRSMQVFTDQPQKLLVGADFQCLVGIASCFKGPEPSFAEGISTFCSFLVLKKTSIEPKLIIFLRLSHVNPHMHQFK